MLRTVLPRQRHAWVTLLRRTQTTTTPPKIPQAPGTSSPPPPGLNQVPQLPPDPQTASSSASNPEPSLSDSKSPPSPPPPPPPAPKPKRRRRFRWYFGLGTTGILAFYGLGTYYAFVSDTFHDFFTEYIPFGEDAVLFWEERAFRQRYPDSSTGSSKTYPQISGESKITVGRQSGVSAKASEASQKTKDAKGTAGQAASQTKELAKDAKTATVSKKDEVKDEAKKAADKTASKAAEVTQKATKAAEQASQAAPIKQIDSLNIDNATDPVVQNVSKILNDVITAVNADGASSTYSSTISKAKDEVQKLASDMAAYRARDAKEADDKIRESQMQFDQGAQELITRISREQREQELAFREEYETERERLSKGYEDKLKAELDAVQNVADQRRRNELLEQSVKLTDQFTQEVRERVEKERSSRLSRLNELARDVQEMESLSKSYANTLEANMQTQHLITAVEAVRTALDDSERPKPFIHELVTLKEIARDDPVVDAAIGSIDPTAYQRGVSTRAQLIDRFRRVADEVRKASLLPEDAGAASHATSFMLSRLMFKKDGLAVGNDVESVLTRTATLLEEGNLDDATREMNGLTGWARVLSRDWLAECRRALEVRQALDVIATESRLQSLRVQ